MKCFHPADALPALLLAQIFFHGQAFHQLLSTQCLEPRYSRTKLHSTQSSQYSIGRLYKVEPNENIDINSHIASLQKVTPEIKPDPLVMDAVEDFYPTQYETYRFFPRNKEEITISVRTTSFGCGKLGSAVWRCALALSCHLVSLFDTYDESQLKSMRVLELGAGLGLPSCVCREVGIGKVLATDFWDEREGFDKSLDNERLIPHKLFGTNLDFNVVKCAGIASQRQNSDGISVDKLDWGSEVGTFRTKVMFDPTLIIASDVVYRAEDAPILVRALELLMGGESATSATNVEAILFLDYNGRNTPDVDAFRSILNEMVTAHSGWSISEVPLKFCYWMDESHESFDEEYSVLEVRISNW